MGLIVSARILRGRRGYLLWYSISLTSIFTLGSHESDKFRSEPWTVTLEPRIRSNSSIPVLGCIKSAWNLVQSMIIEHCQLIASVGTSLERVESQWRRNIELCEDVWRRTKKLTLVLLYMDMYPETKTHLSPSPIVFLLPYCPAIYCTAPEHS